MKLFRAIEHGVLRAYIPTIVVAEVQFVLFSFYAFKRSHVITALKGMVAIPNLRLYDDVSVFRAISHYDMKNVKFIDCLIASSKRVQSENATVLSYDRDFDKLGVRRVEPRQLLKKIQVL